MVALPDRLFMSAAEYLDWEPNQEERYEYWDGEVVAMSGGTRNHNRISLNFSKLLDDALQYVLVQTSQPGVEVFRRNDRGQWVLSEYTLEDSLHLESIQNEISCSA